MQVLNPQAEFPGQDEVASNPLPKSLLGATVGIVNNQKPNASELFARIESRLRDLGVERILTKTKSAPRPAQESDLAALHRECDVVLVGSGD